MEPFNQCKRPISYAEVLRASEDPNDQNKNSFRTTEPPVLTDFSNLNTQPFTVQGETPEFVRKFDGRISRENPKFHSLPNARRKKPYQDFSAETSLEVNEGRLDSDMSKNLSRNSTLESVPDVLLESEDALNKPAIPGLIFKDSETKVTKRAKRKKRKKKTLSLDDSDMNPSHHQPKQLDEDLQKLFHEKFKKPSGTPNTNRRSLLIERNEFSNEISRDNPKFHSFPKASNAKKAEDSFTKQSEEKLAADKEMPSQFDSLSRNKKKRKSKGPRQKNLLEQPIRESRELKDEMVRLRRKSKKKNELQPGEGGMNVAVRNAITEAQLDSTPSSTISRGSRQRRSKKATFTPLKSAEPVSEVSGSDYRKGTSTEILAKYLQDLEDDDFEFVPQQSGLATNNSMNVKPNKDSVDNDQVSPPNPDSKPCNSTSDLVNSECNPKAQNNICLVVPTVESLKCDILNKMGSQLQPETYSSQKGHIESNLDNKEIRNEKEITNLLASKAKEANFVEITDVVDSDDEDDSLPSLEKIESGLKLSQLSKESLGSKNCSGIFADRNETVVNDKTINPSSDSSDTDSPCDQPNERRERNSRTNMSSGNPLKDAVKKEGTKEGYKPGFSDGAMTLKIEEKEGQALEASDSKEKHLSKKSSIKSEEKEKPGGNLEQTGEIKKRQELQDKVQHRPDEQCQGDEKPRRIYEIQDSFTDASDEANMTLDSEDTNESKDQNEGENLLKNTEQAALPEEIKSYEIQDDFCDAWMDEANMTLESEEERNIVNNEVLAKEVRDQKSQKPLETSEKKLSKSCYELQDKFCQSWKENKNVTLEHRVEELDPLNEKKELSEEEQLDRNIEHKKENVQTKPMPGPEKQTKSYEMQDDFCDAWMDDANITLDSDDEQPDKKGDVFEEMIDNTRTKPMLVSKKQTRSYEIQDGFCDAWMDDANMTLDSDDEEQLDKKDDVFVQNIDHTQTKPMPVSEKQTRSYEIQDGFGDAWMDDANMTLDNDDGDEQPDKKDNGIKEKLDNTQTKPMPVSEEQTRSYEIQDGFCDAWMDDANMTLDSDEEQPDKKDDAAIEKMIDNTQTKPMPVSEKQTRSYEIQDDFCDSWMDDANMTLDSDDEEQLDKKDDVFVQNIDHTQTKPMPVSEKQTRSYEIQDGFGDAWMDDANMTLDNDDGDEQPDKKDNGIKEKLDNTQTKPMPVSEEQTRSYEIQDGFCDAWMDDANMTLDSDEEQPDKKDDAAIEKMIDNTQTKPMPVSEKQTRSYEIQDDFCDSWMDDANLTLDSDDEEQLDKKDDVFVQNIDNTQTKPEQVSEKSTRSYEIQDGFCDAWMDDANMTLDSEEESEIRTVLHSAHSYENTEDPLKNTEIATSNFEMNMNDAIFGSSKGRQRVEKGGGSSFSSLDESQGINTGEDELGQASRGKQKKRRKKLKNKELEKSSESEENDAESVIEVVVLTDVREKAEESEIMADVEDEVSCDPQSGVESSGRPTSWAAIVAASDALPGQDINNKSESKLNQEPKSSPGLAPGGNKQAVSAQDVEVSSKKQRKKSGKGKQECSKDNHTAGKNATNSQETDLLSLKYLCSERNWSEVQNCNKFEASLVETLSAMSEKSAQCLETDSDILSRSPELSNISDPPPESATMEQKNGGDSLQKKGEVEVISQSPVVTNTDHSQVENNFPAASSSHHQLPPTSPTIVDNSPTKDPQAPPAPLDKSGVLNQDDSQQPRPSPEEEKTASSGKSGRNQSLSGAPLRCDEEPDIAEGIQESKLDETITSTSEQNFQITHPKDPGVVAASECHPIPPQEESSQMLVSKSHIATEPPNEFCNNGLDIANLEKDFVWVNWLECQKAELFWMQTLNEVRVNKGEVMTPKDASTLGYNPSSVVGGFERIKANVQEITKIVEKLTLLWNSRASESLDTQLSLLKGIEKHLKRLTEEVGSIDKELLILSSEADVRQVQNQVSCLKRNILSLQTDTLKELPVLNSLMKNRRSRFDMIKSFQSTIVDIEQWTLETQGALNAYIKLAPIVETKEFVLLDIGKKLASEQEELRAMIIKLNNLSACHDIRVACNDISTQLSDLKNAISISWRLLQQKPSCL